MDASPALIILILCAAATSLDVQVINQWNLLDFNFPYDYELINSYRPENTVTTGLEITPDRFFLAMPRLRSGVSATLAVVPRNTPVGSSPRLRAYPDWSYHEAGRGNSTPSCAGLISVYRIRVDSCNRLWVLDSGVMTSLEDFRRVCQPKIIIFDLNTDQPVRTVVFPRQTLRPSSLLTNLVIDESVQGTCDSAFVYITDTATPGMVVYDSLKDRAWRVMHPSMFPDPDFGNVQVQGESFTLMDGIVGLTHSPRLATIYYQPLATDRIFSLPTAALRKGPPAEFEELPVTLLGRKSSQGLGLALNPEDDTLFFSPLTEISLASWNPVNSQQDLLSYDPEKLQCPAEIRWIPGDSRSVWLLTTRFQKFFRRTVSPSEVNLRIVRVPLDAQFSHGFANSIFYKK